jgi:hypothetical protein
MTSTLTAVWQRAQLWFWGKFFIVLIALGAGTRRRRMSHNNGTAGRGTLRIVDVPAFPPTEFFEPGRAFPCRVRHGCVSFVDDTVNEVRSASVKFADTDFKSPLDIQMNTGEHCFFWNAKTFLEFAFWRHPHDAIQYEKYYKTYGLGRRSAASAFRRAPDSYALMSYHSHTPFAWHARDGKPRYVRFRLIRGDRRPECNAPDPAYVDAAERDVKYATLLANQKCLPEETRGVNYLRNEWRDRAQAGPISYILQVQFHEASPDDPPEIRNALMPWDEATHPYMDLAEISIQEVLSYAEQCMMAFEITNLPRSMSILPASSIHDFNSLNYMRKQSIFAIRMRRLFQRLFGPPKDVPDDAPHNMSPPGM